MKLVYQVQVVEVEEERGDKAIWKGSAPFRHYQKRSGCQWNRVAGNHLFLMPLESMLLLEALWSAGNHLFLSLLKPM